MAAMDDVKTTIGANNDDEVGIMATLSFQCSHDMIADILQATCITCVHIDDLSVIAA